MPKGLFKLETISKSCGELKLILPHPPENKKKRKEKSGNYSTTNIIDRQAAVGKGASTQNCVRDYYQGGFINLARASPV